MGGIPVLLGQKVLEEIHTSRATYGVPRYAFCRVRMWVRKIPGKEAEKGGGCHGCLSSS